MASSSIAAFIRRLGASDRGATEQGHHQHADLSCKRGLGPGFLIHDSHIFDGVDERQTAKALQFGAERAEALGFQYIVTMNSDALPQEGFQSGFDIRAHVMDTRLTDANETGGLFGLRFE